MLYLHRGIELAALHSISYLIMMMMMMLVQSQSESVTFVILISDSDTHSRTHTVIDVIVTHGDTNGYDATITISM